MSSSCRFLELVGDAADLRSNALLEVAAQHDEPRLPRPHPNLERPHLTAEAVDGLLRATASVALALELGSRGAALRPPFARLGT